jgi:hypothetical protein
VRGALDEAVRDGMGAKGMRVVYDEIWLLRFVL